MLESCEKTVRMKNPQETKYLLTGLLTGFQQEKGI
jgi:hypothetical protein